MRCREQARATREVIPALLGGGKDVTILQQPTVSVKKGDSAMICTIPEVFGSKKAICIARTRRLQRGGVEFSCAQFA